MIVIDFNVLQYIPGTGFLILYSLYRYTQLCNHKSGKHLICNERHLPTQVYKDLEKVDTLLSTLYIMD